MTKHKSTHWMVFVKWHTIVRWKKSMKEDRRRDEPYQYSSNHRRFLQIEPGDVLWVVSTPRFDDQGHPDVHGRARPPAVMARLRVKGKCCNQVNELTRQSKGKKPICINKTLTGCDDPGILAKGVHPAASNWSIVVIGHKDPEMEPQTKPDPFQVTYPVLYNFFGVLYQLEFESNHSVKCLNKYLEFVEGGKYLSPAQQKAKRAGKQVKDPGPYARLGQYLQTPRKLSRKSADVMNQFHRRAVLGKRVFFSYKWTDVEEIAQCSGKTREEWIKELNHSLYQADYIPWLDHHQILTDRDVGDLLDEVLSDAVHQSAVFVALLSNNYGTTGSWTLEEWERAQKQCKNPKRRDRLSVIVLNCGGDPARLGLTKENVISIPDAPAPDKVVQAIKDYVSPIVGIS